MKEGVSIRVLRDGAEVDLVVAPARLGSEDDARLLIWAGLVLRATPRCILERCGESVARCASGVFAQNVLGGSPADARELMAHWFLLELDGYAVQTLSDVLEILRPTHEPHAAASVSVSPGASGERRWVRLRLLDLYGQEHARALQCDPLFFPTLELLRGERGRWRCIQHC